MLSRTVRRLSPSISELADPSLGIGESTVLGGPDADQFDPCKRGISGAGQSL